MFSWVNIFAGLPRSLSLGRVQNYRTRSRTCSRRFNPQKRPWQEHKVSYPRHSDRKLTLVLTDWGRISQAKAIKISRNAQCTYCMFRPSHNSIKNSFVATGVHLCMVMGCCRTYICIPTVAKPLYVYIYIFFIC